MRPSAALLWLGLCALAPASLGGCDDESSETNDTSTATGTGAGVVHDVDEHACEHLHDGPFVDVVAATTPAAAPDVSAEHTAYRIALSTLSGGGGAGGGGAADRGGIVSFAADAQAHYIFFLDADVALAVHDSSGTAVPLLESCDPDACSEGCPDFRGRNVVELGVGTYYLSLGPTSATSVTLVREEEDHGD